MTEVTEVETNGCAPGSARPLMFYVSDENGQGIYLSAPLLEVYGVESRQLLGAGWAEFIHAEDRQLVLEHFLAAIYTRKPYTMKYRLGRVGDDDLWVQDFGLPRCNEAGEFAGFVGLIFFLGEDAPHSAVGVLGESAPAAIVHRFDGVINYWSEAAVALYGWTADEAQGHTLDELICRDALPQLRDTREILRHQTDWSGNFTHLTKDSRSLVVRVCSTYLNHNSLVPLESRDLLTIIFPA